VKTKDSGLESGLEGNDSGNDNGDIHDNDGYDQEVLRAEMNHHEHMNHQSYAASHAHHTMTSIPIHNEHPMTMQSHSQSMPQGQLEQIISHQENANLHNNFSSTANESNVDKSYSSETLPTQASHATQQMSVGGHQNPFVDNSISMSHHQHAQTLTPDMIQRSLQQENYQHSHQQQQHQPFHQGVTLPSNILMQNLGLDQQQSQSQQFSNNASSAITSPIPTQTDNVVDNDSGKQHQDSLTSQFQNQQVGTGDNKQQHQQQQPSSESEQQLPTNDNIISSSVNENNMNNVNDVTQNTSSPSSSAGLGTAAEGGGGSGASEVNNNSNANNAAAATGGDDGQSLNEDSER
jgi:hypothetical protein